MSSSRASSLNILIENILLSIIPAKAYKATTNRDIPLGIRELGFVYGKHLCCLASMLIRSCWPVAIRSSH